MSMVMVTRREGKVQIMNNDRINNMFPMMFLFMLSRLTVNNESFSSWKYLFRRTANAVVTTVGRTEKTMNVNQAYVGATHLLPPMKLVHLPEKNASKMSEMKTRYDNLRTISIPVSTSDKGIRRQKMFVSKYTHIVCKFYAEQKFL